jgi:DNA-binding transcriptional LysR family regulator
MTPSLLKEGNWHGVELRHLVALQAVASERSFSAAARSLGYTQSAISGQIIALERLIGSRLFVRVRGRRPLELTPAGDVLLAHASAILERLKAAQLAVGAAQPPDGPRLRIGAFWGVAEAVLPGVRDRIGADSFELREEGGVEVLLDRVERRTLDLALVPLPARDGPFQWLRVWDDPYVAIAKRGDRIAAGPWLSIGELAAMPLLTLGIVPRTPGFPFDVRASVNTVAAVVSFVDAGHGIGLVPSLALELPLSFTPLRVDPRLPTCTFGLVWHRDLALDTPAQRFVDAVMQVGDGLERAQGQVHAVAAS